MSVKKYIWTQEELQQGSEEWLRWREGEGFCLGGSEVACLMDESPFKTVWDLWEEKMGFVEKEFTDEQQARMDRGNDLEPEARRIYSEERGVKVEQICAMHPEYPWMRTSLDGLTEDRKYVLEIKCPSTIEKHHSQVGKRKASFPSYRYAQMQHQLAVAYAHWGTECVHYVSYFPGEPLVVIPVPADWFYIEELIRRERIFVDYWKRRERPPLDWCYDDNGAEVGEERLMARCSPKQIAGYMHELWSEGKLDSDRVPARYRA